MINNNKKKHIAICTGGTGGHIFPAKALADELIDNNYSVDVMIDYRGYVNKSIWQQNIKLYKICSLGLHSKSFIYILKMLLFFQIGIFQCLYYFIKNRPASLISFGGYSSIPVVMSAVILKIPVIMHEQNAVLGKAHKLFLPFAKVLATSFKDTKYVHKAKKIVNTGLPIRKEFLNNTQIIKNTNKLVILISGGSQGAKILGNIIPKAFILMTKKEQENIKVYHQCREELISASKEEWEKTKVEINIKPFFNNIYDIMKEADLIIGRSGASTIAEIRAMNKKAIYIPFAKSAENHQEINAIQEQKESGAILISEQDLTESKLYEAILKMLSSENKQYNEIVNATKNLKLLVENTINMDT